MAVVENASVELGQPQVDSAQQNHSNGNDRDGDESKKQNYAGNGAVEVDQGFTNKAQQFQDVSNGRYEDDFVYQRSNGDADEGFKRDIKDLEELLSKLNPMAEEFIPPSLANGGAGSAGNFYVNNFMMNNGSAGRRLGL